MCFEHLPYVRADFTLMLAQTARQQPWEARLTWKTPKIVEVPVGMEINMYACAARK
jgi:coenzyme PQQ precursor peptide PqqA